MSVAGARASRSLARFGGEEFICPLPGANAEHLAELTEKLRASIETACITHGASSVSPWVMVSLGATRCQPSSLMPADSLLAQVDKRLYCAKNGGRNRFAWPDWGCESG